MESNESPATEVAIGERPKNPFGPHVSRAGSPNAKTAMTHDAIIDIMIANPRATQPQIAQALGYKSIVSVGVILHSDSFQARYVARRKELADPIVIASLEDRLRGIAHDSAEIVAKRLIDAPGDFKFAMEALKTSAPHLIKPQAPTVNVGFVVHLPGPASSSDEWTRRFAPESGEALHANTDDLPSEEESGLQPEPAQASPPAELKPYTEFTSFGTTPVPRSG